MLVTVSILFFSPEELKLVPEPVLYLIKAFSFRIIERPDLLFTSMWIMLVVTSFAGTIYASSIGLVTVMNAINFKKSVIITSVICFLLAINFQGIYEIDFISKIQNYYLVPVFCGLPILLLFISILYKKKAGVTSI